MASPFVSKLAGTAAQVHSDCPFDVIFSHYLEPYGVAALLDADMTRVPHVARMAYVLPPEPFQQELSGSRRATVRESARA